MLREILFGHIGRAIVPAWTEIHIGGQVQIRIRNPRTGAQEISPLGEKSVWDLPDGETAILVFPDGREQLVIDQGDSTQIDMRNNPHDRFTHLFRVPKGWNNKGIYRLFGQQGWIEFINLGRRGQR